MMFIQVIAGLVLLLGGAEIMVRGAMALAGRLGVSPLVVGMTVVAFGTSAPELVVSLDAALTGSPGMAIGNMVGSNVANILLILGFSGLIAPILVEPKSFLRDGMVLMAGSLVFAGLCWLGEMGRASGTVLLVLFAAFLGYSYWREKKGGGGEDEGATTPAGEVEEIGVPRSIWHAWMLLLAGLAGVIYGADLLVDGGMMMARAAGISEEVIGLTLLAFGTSLPELAAAAAAAYRGQSDLVLGNVVGSNLFNILGIMGVVAMVTPLAVPAQIMAFDIWVMLGATAVMIPVMISDHRLSRVEAALFLAAYIAYMGVQAYGVSNIISLPMV